MRPLRLGGCSARRMQPLSEDDETARGAIDEVDSAEAPRIAPTPNSIEAQRDELQSDAESPYVSREDRWLGRFAASTELCKGGAWDIGGTRIVADSGTTCDVNRVGRAAQQVTLRLSCPAQDTKSGEEVGPCPRGDRADERQARHGPRAAGRRPHPMLVRTPQLDSRFFRHASKLLILLLAGAALWLAWRTNWLEAGALAVLAMGGGAFIYLNPRLPSLFTLLFLLAGTVNAAGYIYTLWKQPYVFDEGVHAFTTFTGCAAIGWYLLSGTHLSRPARLVAIVAGIGLVLGVGWELFEWAIGIIGDWGDTLLDLVMDMVGAVAAGFFCVWAGRAAERT